MAENESVTGIFNVMKLNMPDESNKTPTINLSGAIFISGGALWYKGFGGTYTEVAGA